MTSRSIGASSPGGKLDKEGRRFFGSPTQGLRAALVEMMRLPNHRVHFELPEELSAPATSNAGGAR